jgi:hypothetical protein
MKFINPYKLKITSEKDFKNLVPNGNPQNDNKIYSIFYYNDIRLEQSLYVIRALDLLTEILSSENSMPVTIIEIGMREGGFTNVLYDHQISTHAEIYSFDIFDFNYESKFKDKNINWFVSDAFKNEEKIKDLIQRKGTTIVFCDGGDKIKEFNLFAKYLKPKDMILAHDYYKDKDAYNNQSGVWPYWESNNEEIIQTCINNNLEEFLEEDFNKSFWTCRRKHEI